MLLTDWFQSIAWLDTVGLAAIGLLIVLGVVRGLWWQVVRLIGVVAAVAVARTWDQDLMLLLTERWNELEPRIALGLGWLLLFLAALTLATLLGRLGAGLLSAMQLGLANRVAGGLVGAATGLLLHVTLLVALCQLAPTPFLLEHVAGTWSEGLVHALAVERRVVLGAESGASLGGTFERPTDEGSAPGKPASAGEPTPDDLR
ncbi:MAG: CvpA family protein [Planctomycetota bacterium]